MQIALKAVLLTAAIYTKKKITQIDNFREKETKPNLREHHYLAEKEPEKRPEEKEIL